jgi:hypothetical protein
VLGLLGPRALEAIAEAPSQLDALDVDALVRAHGPIAESLASMPFVERDLALLVPRLDGLEVGVGSKASRWS